MHRIFQLIPVQCRKNKLLHQSAVLKLHVLKDLKDDPKGMHQYSLVSDHLTHDRGFLKIQ